MELMEVIQERRAVREFTEEPVSREMIERLIGAAILAPSALNRQPWSFAVCVDGKRIACWGERARVWALENLAATGFGESAREYLERPDLHIFHGAPALVLVAAQPPDAHAMEDCCLAAQNLMLAARDQGIGSCWIGLARAWMNLPSTKKELAIPAGSHVVAPIILGHPKVWPAAHGRRPAEIHWL